MTRIVEDGPALLEPDNTSGLTAFVGSLDVGDSFEPDYAGGTLAQLVIHYENGGIASIELNKSEILYLARELIGIYEDRTSD